MKNTFFPDKTAYLNIKEVSEILEVHSQTVRNWEKQGLIHPQRIGGHQRLFTGEVLTKLERIKDLKDKGWNIQAIKQFLDEEDKTKGES